MNVTHHRPQPGGSRTYRIAGGLVAMAVALVMTSAAAADVLTATAARALVAAAAAKPSVHAERPEIEAALRAGGVAAAEIARLWEAVDAAALPGAGSRLDGFLFLTRDPQWQR